MHGKYLTKQFDNPFMRETEPHRSFFTIDNKEAKPENGGTACKVRALPENWRSNKMNDSLTCKDALQLKAGDPIAGIKAKAITPKMVYNPSQHKWYCRIFRSVKSALSYVGNYIKSKYQTFRLWNFKLWR